MRIFVISALAVLLAAPLAAQDKLTNVPDPDPALQQAALRSGQDDKRGLRIDSKYNHKENKG